MSNLDLCLKKEEELKKRAKKIRIIMGVIIAVFFIVFIVFSVLYNGSRTVEIVDYGFLEREEVSYNEAYNIGSIFCFFVFMLTSLYLIMDLIYSRLTTVEMNGNYVTYYKGLVHNKLYINGEYKDGFAGVGYYLEATLPDMTRVTVSIGRNSAHMSFSNGRSLDI